MSLLQIAVLSQTTVCLYVFPKLLLTFVCMFLPASGVFLEFTADLASVCPSSCVLLPPINPLGLRTHLPMRLNWLGRPQLISPISQGARTPPLLYPASTSLPDDNPLAVNYAFYRGCLSPYSRQTTCQNRRASRGTQGKSIGKFRFTCQKRTNLLTWSPVSPFGLRLNGAQIVQRSSKR